jgi:hypothetical protein
MQIFGRRPIQVAVVFFTLSIAMTRSAKAGIAFSGSGASGVLSAPSETWSFDHDGGAAQNGYLNDWGSPGVGEGEASFGGAVKVYGIKITFTGGGAIDPSSVATGNASPPCSGGTGNGTAFCDASTGEVWKAFLIGPKTIEFLAQNPSNSVSPGESYFMDVFFHGATPASFTGEWLTEYAPSPAAKLEPGSLLLADSEF